MQDFESLMCVDRSFSTKMKLDLKFYTLNIIIGPKNKAVYFRGMGMKLKDERTRASQTQSVAANHLRQCQVCQNTSNSQNLAQSSAIGSALNPEPIAVCSLASLITVQADT